MGRLVEREVTSSGIRFMKEEDCPIFKTEYFPDGSAIIVTERGIVLVEKTAEYEVSSPGLEPQ